YSLPSPEVGHKCTLPMATMYRSKVTFHPSWICSPPSPAEMPSTITSSDSRRTVTEASPVSSGLELQPASAEQLERARIDTHVRMRSGCYHRSIADAIELRLARKGPGFRP